MEVWKVIDGYETLYEVSNLGRVRGLKRGRMLSPRANQVTGYLEVNLCKDGTQRTVRVHRLVALAFLPNPSSLPEVNHKDENKNNCSIENLEWCDHRYNTNYGTRNIKIRKAIAKLSSKDIEKIKLLRDNKSVREIAHMFGVSDSQIYRILNGVNWGDVS